MRALAVFIALCGLSLLCTASVYKPADFQAESHFDGRSGDITLFPSKIIQDDAQFILLDNMFKYNPEMSSISESSIGELIAHLMGSASLNSHASRAGFPKIDVFNRPKANLLFTVAGVGAETPTLKNLKAMNPTANSQMSITEKHCHDASCSLTSMMTSSTPSVHGIVASKWADQHGDVVKAFSNEGALPVVSNLMDTFSENWDSRSLMISASACRQTSAALTTRPTKAPAVYALHFDSEKGQFVPVYKGSRADDVLAIRTAAVKQILQSLALPGVKLSVEGDIVRVEFDDAQVSAAEFDMSIKYDAALLSEIAFVQNALEVLHSDARFSVLVADSNPDLFSFGFVGLKGIQFKHGKGSKEFIAALTLLDAFINAMAGEMSSLYQGKLIAEVVLMGSTHNSPVDNKDAKNIAQSRVASIISKDAFDALYPELYMPTSGFMAITNACFDLKRQLTNFGIDVYCPEKTANFFNYRIGQSNTSNNTNSTTSDPNPNFQILLWSGITLALAMMAAVAVLCFMDVGKDTLIYRTQSHGHAHPHAQ